MEVGYAHCFDFNGWPGPGGFGWGARCCSRGKRTFFIPPFVA
jgi:hypothetical protein